MKAWRFAAFFKGLRGFIYAPGNTADDARKKASKLTKQIQGGERAGYIKDGSAAYFARG